MRNAEITRNSAETKISLKLCVDGEGSYDIATGCGFLDHMLSLFSRHGRFDITLRSEGDTQVDFHHTTEDVGIVLGSAFREALGERRGILRYGSATIPMDEALVLCATDVSGRAHCEFALEIPTQKVGDFDTELVQEFFFAFSRALGLTVHVRSLAGRNSHHIIEAAFKAFARSLAQSVSVDEKHSGEIPSTKGLLD